jgi:glycerate kinase
MLCESNIMVYTDVTNPFTGINGASQVYGPQKGANSAMVHALEKGADHLNHLIMRKYGLDLNLMKGSGAAGGMGGGSVVFLRSKLMRGIDLIFSLTQFD